MDEPLTDQERAYVFGAWAAFNCVLSHLNTLEDRMISKAGLYHAVSDMRPLDLLKARQNAQECSGFSPAISTTYRVDRRNLPLL